MENEGTFTIMPMSQRISLTAGETYEGSITVVNPADATEDFAYKTKITPYGVVGEDYKADLMSTSKYTSMAEWIQIEEPTGKVKPNESKKINFKIKVPENAPAGGQYATIAVSSDQSNNATSGVAVQNVFEMASIIYATVAGDTKHEGEILDNYVPSFVLSGPVKLTASISNNGNIHETATVVITASDFFTGNVILPNEEVDGQFSEIIMPDTTRYIEREVSNLPALGVVKVSQTIYYLGKEPSVVEKNIIICPVWFLLLLILTFIALISTIVFIIRKHLRRKKVAAEL